MGIKNAALLLYLMDASYLGIKFITHVFTKVVNFIWCLGGGSKMVQYFNVGVSPIQLLSCGKFLRGPFACLRAIDEDIKKW